MIIPFILGTIAVISVYVGFVKFKESKEEPQEVDHEEPPYDKFSDLPKPLHFTRAGYHGQSEIRRHWNRTGKEQYRAIQGWCTKQL